MTIQNIIDNCGQRKRDLDELASKFNGQDPDQEVSQTGIDLMVAITGSISAANGTAVEDYICT